MDQESPPLRAGRTSIYEIPVVIQGGDFDRLKHVAERIQKKYYIAPRDEWVTDEEYCAFFGSSGNLWDPARCPYQQGDFAEMLRQTIYDMDNCDPKIYNWTNVPRRELLQKRIRSSKSFKGFFEKELEPLITACWGAARRQGDVEALREQFTAVADAAEQYKKQHGIKRL